MSSADPVPTTLVLTGATSGIGEAVARLLVPRAARLIVHGPRHPTEVDRFLGRLRDLGRSEVHYVQADFDDLTAVVALAGRIAALTDRVDVLINNAGRPGPPTRQLSDDSNELTLQTNYLAPVLLTDRLAVLLRAAHGRVVHVASATHLSASLDPDDLNMEHTAYSPTVAYARSKLGLVAHAQWLVDQAPSPRVDAVSVHPGVIRTALLHAMFDIGGAPVAQGARNVVQAALSANAWDGRYLAEDRPAQPNPAALDPEFRSRLMTQTSRLTSHLSANDRSSSAGWDGS
ncbi:NAD(P)-dependent dehydrogenase (short-subunit alcohol dehydrogenase family) [Streptomyces sp. T12]|uniref:SDR family NAD(P)-dependent oxidoreductase n=1 Tax=Streptomyces sp. T12 TaxID=477697 RepID=UPI0011A8124D|nr:SDR family NAD(P)-dependent oxidoreductase [Streptomyces sp. T12]TWD17648.1 NAD(P)-dependent dehydrogenase (short-subunit alcohol dehydrogenase family) [Streptomyces sp. T12]